MATSASHHISRKAVTTLLHSPRTAAAIGRPMNVVVCIDMRLLGIAAEEASATFRKMRRQKFGRWSGYKPRGTGTPKNGTPVDTWVIEAPNGRHHVHWMLHIQPENRAEFEEKLVRWVRSMAGMKLSAPLPDGALHVTDAHNPEGKKLYMAKGIDPFYARLFRITHVPGGIVFGRRAGTARALGPSVWKPLKRGYLARKRAGLV
ncbi:hypothetical protein SAMN05444398_1383 [Roseovarius pacificus]|uniref:Bacteriophage replication gene A protein (GPA) n=1 Tax=Roseovarius pacificus TaxID=337701 RepID=A0A1M7KUX6_9RHOB|nr:hypothetical protein SAMN05444398_1383 [Roseovarius pacificus]